MFSVLRYKAQCDNFNAKGAKVLAKGAKVLAKDANEDHKLPREVFRASGSTKHVTPAG